jgi:hypothetical protein
MKMRSRWALRSFICWEPRKTAGSRPLNPESTRASKALKPRIAVTKTEKEAVSPGSLLLNGLPVVYAMEASRIASSNASQGVYPKFVGI